MPNPTTQNSDCANIHDPGQTTTFEQIFDANQLDAFRAAIEASEDRSQMHAIQAPTGFGKTVLGAGLAEAFVKDGYTVLWIAKKWRLLEQAAAEIERFSPSLKTSFRRFGGARSGLGELATDKHGQIYFTTLSQWHASFSGASLPEKLKRRKKLLVIWDECHWAINATIGNALLDFYVREPRRYHRGNAAMIGLSATPKSHVGGRVGLAWAIPYVATLGTRTAYPIHKDVETGVVWDPIVANHQIDQSSLDELAKNSDRNDKVIAELTDGFSKGIYTRILVFACNIKHANRLHQMISEQGIASACLHSGLSRARRDEAVQKFRDGQVTVLVNVNEFVEGDNVPEIDAIFIARPATSETLLRQMIGRGSRLTPTKHQFTVVEFTDVVRNNSHEFYHADSLIEDGRSTSKSAREYRYRGPTRHAAPSHSTIEEIAFPEIGRIPIVHDQTFGVEIELTSRSGFPDDISLDWDDTALQIIGHLQESASAMVDSDPTEYHESDDTTCWRVEYDSSAGWEVVSPILSNAEGLHELRRVCAALTELVETDPDLHINHRTGLHVTLGTRLDNDDGLRGFIGRLLTLEPGLMTLVSPSRLFAFRDGRYDLRERNTYCFPLRETLGPTPTPEMNPIDLFAADRYRTINLTRAYENVQTMEVRLHNGTTEFRKIAPWISLWMQICHQSRHDTDFDGTFGPVFPGGNCEIAPDVVQSEDIFALLASARVVLGPDMINLLTQRRRELRPNWERAIPNRVKSWESAGWYDAPSVDGSSSHEPAIPTCLA